MQLGSSLVQEIALCAGRRLARVARSFDVVRGVSDENASYVASQVRKRQNTRAQAAAASARVRSVILYEMIATKERTERSSYRAYRCNLPFGRAACRGWESRS